LPLVYASPERAFFEVDRPTFRYTLQRAIAEGYLVPYRIYKAMTVKTAAKGGAPALRPRFLAVSCGF
jgi:type I site-specific restriction endonuclease